MSLSIVVVLLLGAVAYQWGGYDPWALLTLQLGAAGLLLALVAAELLKKEVDPERRRRRLRAWKRLPFWVRRQELARLARLATLGRFPARRSSGDVEILLPGGAEGDSIELDPSRESFLLGLPVRRTGLLAPIALLTIWVALSLVPLSMEALRRLSPEAGRLRADAAGLLDLEPGRAPATLAPFLSLRGLWLWLAVVALFYVALRIVRRPGGAERLSSCLVVLGIASGILGAAGWIGELKDAYGVTSETLRATGTFGNPNHFASFQSMLLLVGVGWLASLRERLRKEAPSRRARSPERRNENALTFVAGLGIAAIAVALLLSLSRSGIAFAFVGATSFVLLTRGRESRKMVFVLALAVAGLAAWMGIEPLVGRFANLEDQWLREGTRIQVWRDSAPAVRDFWLLGSGLGSFRYVGARYRSFGGTIFYSWAHNDYLQLAIELGIPGLLLVGWLGIAVVRAAARVRRDLVLEKDLSLLHAGSASALVAVALHSATDFGLHLPANLALAAVLVALVVGIEPTSERKTPISG